jgi:hypothetical protein
MPSVINLAENKRSTPAHDEWATIGVHLATRVAQGQTREQAVAAVAALGVHPGRIQRYIKREGLAPPRPALRDQRPVHQGGERGHPGVARV